MLNSFSLNTQRHAFHLVDPSILPFLTSISALCLTVGSVLFFHGYSGGLESTLFGFLGVLSCMFI
jgi:cytochrome c oxidase subunit 3